MNIIAISQARVGSKRFPSKILKKINEKSILQIHIERVLKSKKISKLIIATTTNEEDNIVYKLSNFIGVECFRGSEDDVLDRYYNAAKLYNADYIVRITSDCPLIDPELIDEVIESTVNSSYDYGNNVLFNEYPDGQDVEVIKFTVLETAWKNSLLSSEREHVTPYIWKNSPFKGKKKFTCFTLRNQTSFKDVRMTIDHIQDFKLIEKLIQQAGTNAKWQEYTKIYQENHEISSINKDIIRNEGYKKSIENEK